MKYISTMRCNGYDNIVEVTEDGTYKSVNRWDDGTIQPVYTDTLERMGWNSLKEFLAARGKRFRFVKT